MSALWSEIAWIGLAPLIWLDEHITVGFPLSLVVVCLLFLVAVVGLLRQKKSCIAGFLSAWLALLALTGAVHAWGESSDLYFTGFYLSVCVLSVVSSVRQFSVCWVVRWLKNRIEK
ncbi:hypothetical protein [Kistimonas asteriae]|uniref:hypothetical protein n=1 Tax=Kistimonas asteriae TaxID=517724 RepID=UPI001BA4F562|nr:hypothetical protein [Kistimonas asteriae]